MSSVGLPALPDNAPERTCICWMTLTSLPDPPLSTVRSLSNASVRAITPLSKKIYNFRTPTPCSTQTTHA